MNRNRANAAIIFMKAATELVRAGMIRREDRTSAQDAAFNSWVRRNGFDPKTPARVPTLEEARRCFS